MAEETSAGFEEFAAKGGTMEARPECFLTSAATKRRRASRTRSCLKGVHMSRQLPRRAGVRDAVLRALRLGKVK